MWIYPSPLGAKSQIPEVYLYDYFELQPVVTTLSCPVNRSLCIFKFSFATNQCLKSWLGYLASILYNFVQFSPSPPNRQHMAMFHHGQND